MNLTIIIPAFNRLWSLPEAIASCPKRDDVEIIVVDDGSTDGTWEWLSSQPGLNASRQRNAGKGRAVNAAYERARGRFIRFLDSDDLLLTDAADRQLQDALARGPDISVAGYTALDVRSGHTVEHPWHDCDDFLAQQLGECDSSHYSAYLFRRDFLSDIRHRPEFNFRDDRMFVIECAMKHPVVTIWPEPTLLHRHHDRGRVQFQLGSAAIVTDWQDVRMFKAIANQLEEAGELTDRRRAALSNNIWPLALRIAGHHRAEGRAALRWLWSLYPAFRIPPTGRSRLYSLFGFTVAQTLVNALRAARNLARAPAAVRLRSGVD